MITWLNCTIATHSTYQIKLSNFVKLVKENSVRNVTQNLESEKEESALNWTQRRWTLMSASVTRFGENSPIWQNCTSLGKLLTFFDIFWHFLYFLFSKMLSILWQICYSIGLIFIATNGQILKNNLTILSYWCQP